MNRQIHFSDSPANRIYAMVLRYWFLLRRSLPRIIELLYWPILTVLLWGLISRFFATNSSWVAEAAGVLIAAVILWDVLFRSQLGLSICFMEEMWARNLGHLFVSPLRPWEWLVAMMVTSLIRLAIGVIPAMLIAIPLYHYSIFAMGPPLIAFLIGLIVMGWWLSLFTVALILRFGLGAESLAWMAAFMLAPISAVYYPVSTLPAWLQPVAWALPSSHIFEGMRAVMFQHQFRIDLFTQAMGLNVLYSLVAVAVFAIAFRNARMRGALLQTGE